MNLAILALLLIGAGGEVNNAPGTMPPPPGELAPGVPHLTPDQFNEAFAIGKELRCPVCQGMPIAESPSTMAQDMMKVVQRMLAEGKSRDDINNFFVARYGEWVLLQPPTHGFNGVVWVLPPTLLALAILWGLRHMAGLRREAPKPVGTPAAAPNSAAADPYIQAIRDEVQK